MIDVQVRIHDRFAVEFKIGYVVRKDRRRNDFMVNTWMFVPSHLDVNAETYSKKQFYRDVKSNVRLITPVYRLKELAAEDALPFRFLEAAYTELVADPSRENLREAEYQLKMFCSIVKSALRREADRVRRYSESGERLVAVRRFIAHTRQVIARFRRLENLLLSGVPDSRLCLLRTPGGEDAGEGAAPAAGLSPAPDGNAVPFPGTPLPPFPSGDLLRPSEATPSGDLRLFHAFGDEFLSNQVEFHSYRLLERLRKRDEAIFRDAVDPAMELVREEIAYRRSKGYPVVEKESRDHNRRVLFRLRMLRQYAESQLSLNLSRKKDGEVAEQVSFSIAAGISMIFATIISFSFQQKYGNYTMPLFVALVVSYMLKDRIKELTRYYFVHRLAKKYFDNKTVVSIKDTPIGWIKEGVDFITEERVPEEVIARRDRSDLLEANNRHTAERIILYRTLVRIDGRKLDEANQYDVAGIHDILRFNVSSFLLKMENPEVPLVVPRADAGYEVVNGERIYYINFLMQLRSDEQVEYKRFRLIMSRNGIEGIEKF